MVGRERFARLLPLQACASTKRHGISANSGAAGAALSLRRVANGDASIISGIAARMARSANIS